MVVPVGKKVRLLITSNDVIHGWYVPQLGVNQYGIPGFIKDAWFTAEKWASTAASAARSAARSTPTCRSSWTCARGGTTRSGSTRRRRRGRAPARRAKPAAGRRAAAGAAAPAAAREDGRGRAQVERREGLRGQLRRVPPAHGQGHAARFPGARRLEDRHRAEGRAPRHRAERQARHGDGVLRAPVRRGDRLGHHLRAHVWGNNAGEVYNPPKSPRRASNEHGTKAEHIMANATHAHDHGHGHDHAHEHHGPPRASRAGCTRRTTRTSARCTSGSRSPCSSSAARWRWASAPSSSSRACSSSIREFFNSLTTIHGLVMVFGAIMPAVRGLRELADPDAGGRADMAFPRMNNWSFWLLIPAAMLLIGRSSCPGGAAAFGLDALSAAGRSSRAWRST